MGIEETVIKIEEDGVVGKLLKNGAATDTIREFVNGALNAADQNGNGEITAAELTQAMPSLEKDLGVTIAESLKSAAITALQDRPYTIQEIKEALEAVISSVDVNSNGVVSPTELAQAKDSLALIGQ